MSSTALLQIKICLSALKKNKITINSRIVEVTVNQKDTQLIKCVLIFGIFPLQNLSLLTHLKNTLHNNILGVFWNLEENTENWFVAENDRNVSFWKHVPHF